MKVCEIFTSIQGESTFAGVPCMFIRMTGCNLRCSYCDTAYAYEEGTELSEKEIVERIQALGLRTVEITGGEPLLQEEVLPLVKNLADRGYRVLIETNGSRDIQGLDRRAVIILDVKTPGSGMAGELKLSNLSFLKPEDEVKFVIADRRDYEWSRDFVREHVLTKRCTVLFSPVFGTMEPQALSQWILHDRLEVRLNLQLHKYIYGPETRGV
jgi:7-carboxy-7-deazaguanine synthase